MNIQKTPALLFLAFATASASLTAAAPPPSANAQLLRARLDRILAARQHAPRATLATAASDTWTEQKLIADGGKPYQQLGSAVAIDRDTAIAGAIESGARDDSVPAGTGAAFIFRNVAGRWVQDAELRADDGAAGDFFGYAVAVSGDTAVVGADDATVDGATDRGAAYVFHRADGVWTQTAKLIAADGISGDLFANAVAIDGDTIAVGAYGATVGGHFGQGAVYLFSRDGSEWKQSAKLSAADGAGLDQLGFSLALHGGVLLSGAPNAVGTDGTAGAGAVYMFEAGAAGWSQTQKIVAADGAAADAFGVSVAFDGARAVVSAPFGNALLGSAYTFARDASGWTQTQKLLPEQGVANDVLWGYAVSISGNRLIVTEPAYDSSLGRADLYRAAADGWSLQQIFTASDAEHGTSLADNFGLSGVIAGGTILIGQPYSTIDANLYQGAVYFYEADRIFASGFDGE